MIRYDPISLLFIFLVCYRVWLPVMVGLSSPFFSFFLICDGMGEKGMGLRLGG